jgi:predicted transcriptional regulator
MKNLPPFEEMMLMAKENPEQLEELRLSMCEEVIKSAPIENQKKLKGLQFKINATILSSSNALSSCVKISKMMNESFLDLNDSLNNFINGKKKLDLSSPTIAKRSKVISFKDHKKKEK